MGSYMWIRESSQDVPVVDLKISVLQQTLSKDITLVLMNLHSAYIRQVHRFTWNL